MDEFELVNQGYRKGCQYGGADVMTLLGAAPDLRLLSSSIEVERGSEERRDQWRGRYKVKEAHLTRPPSLSQLAFLAPVL